MGFFDDALGDVLCSGLAGDFLDGPVEVVGVDGKELRIFVGGFEPEMLFG